MSQINYFEAKEGLAKQMPHLRRLKARSMAIIPYRGWDISRWFDEDDDWFGWPSMKLVKMPGQPKVDIYEKDGNVVAEAEMPGFKPEQISAQIQDNILVLEAKSEEKKEEEDKKKGYYRKETSRGYVKRVLPLPMEVVAEKAEAEFEDGILKITVPKAKPQVEETKAKKLEIKKK